MTLDSHCSTTGAKRLAGVGVAGCKHTTRDFILGLKRNGFLIDHCLTISPEMAHAAQVAGYYDLRPWLEQECIPHTVATKYTLKTDQDRQQLLALQLRLLLVIG